jgi:cytochrome c biogenesis protein CcdA
MTLFVLAYLGGLMTIISPCILPVLPFVFARAAPLSSAADCRCWPAWQ